MQREAYVDDTAAFHQLSDHAKMILVVTDDGPRPNQGAAGWGPLIRQYGSVTMMWKHSPTATNKTMEPRAATEALGFLSPNMVVFLLSHSKCVRQCILQRIHKWKRNGWKNSKMCGVANKTLWRELDSAIGRQARIEFTCADQLATRAVGGISYGTEIPVRPNEPESEEALVVTDDEVTQ
jgi:ribonuclease HI